MQTSQALGAHRAITTNDDNSASGSFRPDAPIEAVLLGRL
jgi:hypothetical protein